MAKNAQNMGFSHVNPKKGAEIAPNRFHRMQLALAITESQILPKKVNFWKFWAKITEFQTHFRGQIESENQ